MVFGNNTTSNSLKYYEQRKSSKKVYSSNFKRVLAIWLCYLTLKISGVPCTDDDVS